MEIPTDRHLEPNQVLWLATMDDASSSCAHIADCRIPWVVEHGRRMAREDGKVRFMEHDFFAERPVKGADVDHPGRVRCRRWRRARGW